MENNLTSIQGLFELGLRVWEYVYNGFRDVLVWLNKPIGEVVAQPLSLIPENLKPDWLEWLTEFLTNQFFQNASSLDLMFATMGILLGSLIMLWIWNALPIF